MISARPPENRDTSKQPKVAQDTFGNPDVKAPAGEGLVLARLAYTIDALACLPLPGDRHGRIMRMRERILRIYGFVTTENLLKPSLSRGLRPLLRFDGDGDGDGGDGDGDGDGTT